MKVALGGNRPVKVVVVLLVTVVVIVIVYGLFFAPKKTDPSDRGTKDALGN